MLSEQSIKLISLLDEGKSANEICSILNLSNRQLFSNLTNLRNKGIMYRQKYYSNGVIRYANFKNLNSLRNYYNFSSNDLITPLKSESFRCLCVSDLHFGNSKERLDLINRAFEYCINNGIHIILCCGDLIDGTYSKGEQSITDVFKQTEYFILNYPFDKNILTFGVAGDHDFSALKKYNQSIVEALRSYRHDVILGDYNNTVLNIKNDAIQMYHSIGNEGGFVKKNSSLALHGHAHEFKADYVQNILEVVIPSLSDITDSLPTMIDMELSFDKGNIVNVLLKQIYLSENKAMELNKVEYRINRMRDDINYIKNEELFKNEEIAEGSILTKTLDSTSQIEKFNKKYNI